jgi:rhodanese-related sulfurtransferase
MVNQVDVREVSAACERGEVVIDVREPFEFASGHIPCARHIPMHLVPLRIDEIPSDRAVYVVCASGNRSWQVCQFLERQGIAAFNVNGGTSAWQAAGLPLKQGVVA